jgi:hypothetical protein
MPDISHPSLADWIAYINEAYPLPNNVEWTPVEVERLIKAFVPLMAEQLSEHTTRH